MCGNGTTPNQESYIGPAAHKADAADGHRHADMQTLAWLVILQHH